MPLSEQGIDFLWELSLNNERPWFQARREEYRRLVEAPFKELAEAARARMDQLWPEESLGLHVSRIYRDARRLFGRGPYHDHLWFSLQRQGAERQGPMLWFEFGVEGSSHGAGFWNCTARQAELYRANIDRDPEGFAALVLEIPDREKSRLWGEEYKRPKGDRGELLNPWYNRKEPSVGYENYFGQGLFAQDLPERLAESFGGLMPMYRFFRKIYEESLKENSNFMNKL